LHDFEGHHYYSSNCAGAITIPHLFEICHFVRQTPSVAHLQAYRRPSYFRMDGFALPSHFTDMRGPHVSLLQPPAPSPSIDSPHLSLIWGSQPSLRPSPSLAPCPHWPASGRGPPQRVSLLQPPAPSPSIDSPPMPWSASSHIQIWFGKAHHGLEFEASARRHAPTRRAATR
jgi:hypothetical protein